MRKPFEERSKYRDITVTQVGERRCLLFNVHRGDRNQTCMMLDDPNRLVFDYTRMSFAGLLLQQAPQSISDWSGRWINPNDFCRFISLKRK